MTTKRLNEQITRNPDRFPSDFVFRLIAAEKAEVVANCDHLEGARVFQNTAPMFSLKHGAIQAANVLTSQRAVEMGIYVARAFVQLKEIAPAHAEWARRLDGLENKTDALALAHDASSRDTRQQPVAVATSCKMTGWTRTGTT